MRVFADPTSVAAQIEILTRQFAIQDVIFVGDRDMVKSAGKQALGAAGLRYIGALTDPRIRKLLAGKTLQMELFAEQVREVDADGVRFIPRKHPEEARRIQHRRLDDKLAKLRRKIEQRNERVENSVRSKPEAGLRVLQQRLEGRRIVESVNRQEQPRALELAGCYVIVTDVVKDKLSSQQVHDSYLALQKVERDFRTMKTGLLEVRPVFVRKESRTRGHVLCCLLALKLSRKLERRLAGAFGTTDQDPNAVTVPDEPQQKILASLKVSLPGE